MKIAFDLYGTLIRSNKQETQTLVSFLKILKKAGHTIIVWSGQDIEEIILAVKKLELENFVDKILSKSNVDQDFIPDIAFDDTLVALATKTVIKI